MVKLQKHKAYTYKTGQGEKIEHYKHTIIIPEGAVRILGWKEGDELETKIEGRELVLKLRGK
jgi:hypothetical protein